MLRAPTQVSWKRSARAMTNFHCDGRCLPPLSETPCVAIGRCARRGSYVSLGGPIERLGHLRFVPNPSEGDFGLFRAATGSPYRGSGGREAPASLGHTAGYAES